MTDLITLDEAKENQEAFLNQLIETKGANLPATVDKVLRVFEFTDWKAKAFKSLSDKLSRLEDQTEAYHSALRSGQNWGIAALYAQKRMGEITRDIKGPGSDWATSGRSEVGTKEAQLHKKGIGKTLNSTRHIYTDAERIASHPEILDATIEAAKKHNEIPTKTSVLNRIRMESAKVSAQEKREKVNDKIDKQRPKAVSDYFDAVKIFKHAIGLAKIAAERGKFDPAGKNFLIKKREEITSLMKELEELV